MKKSSGKKICRLNASLNVRSIKKIHLFHHNSKYQIIRVNLQKIDASKCKFYKLNHSFEPKYYVTICKDFIIMIQHFLKVFCFHKNSKRNVEAQIYYKIFIVINIFPKIFSKYSLNSSEIKFG